MRLIIWMIIGLATIYVAAAIHLIQAEQKGYKAIEWWKENNKYLLSDTEQLPFKFVLGLVIWPVRLWGFFQMIPDLYELYEHK